MGSRLRWFILGNLIGIIALVVGVMLINANREKGQDKTTQPPEQTTPSSPQTNG